MADKATDWQVFPFPRSLRREIAAYAKAQNRTITTVVEDAVRDWLCNPVELPEDDPPDSRLNGPFQIPQFDSQLKHRFRLASAELGLDMYVLARRILRAWILR